MTVAYDPVHRPLHYNNHPSGIECIEVTRLLCYDTGNATKYVWRRGDKGNPAQDLDKSLFYLADARNNVPECRYVPQRAVELLYRVAAAEPDPDAAKFYTAVAEMQWDAAEDAVRKLRAAFPV
ncbi:Protein of unknwon function (DUF3310) [Mycobacteroides abscessus]|uniref:Protein of unknwon function (DUF3310) n=4 Tax=Mycobacteroides TaxID=670516 RepID=A0AB74FF00_9MYCO|nr:MULTISPECIES: DUF3310 domain-containing protein [Mycobacteroides]AMU26712.1 hypothetical protein A3N96_16050 [Mycobacteroides abscessus]AMU36394.1 hypothetical protein A3N98_15245 [Mycobacteroides abscessus]AMU41442.1 hypothetical protein A3N99_15840 [Mycobacteroides abscessus]AMU61418.1 hypothetical protein A3O03_15960 [Mycobacteroides abscessus]MBN7339871.1 DUF3310 domain-containing protein [Mycobacteroides abscessus subsp. massiliense]